MGNLKSFDEVLERPFPELHRKAYYLMSFHEHLPRPIRHELKQLGWSKAAELAKVARRAREQFKSADWLHKAYRIGKLLATNVVAVSPSSLTGTESAS